MTLKTLKILLIAAALSSGSVFAADAKPPVTAGNSLWDLMTFSYTGWGFGPSIKSPLEDHQPDAATGKNTGAPITWVNYVTAGFKLTPTITFSGVFVTAFQAPAPQDPNTVSGGSRLLKVKDPYLKLNNSNLYSNGGYKLSTSSRLLLPTSYRKPGAPQKDITFEQRFYNDYDVPNTKLTLSTLVIADLNIWHNAPPAVQVQDGMSPSQQEFFLYLGPNVNYQILPTLGLGLLWEVAAYTERQSEMFNFYHGTGNTDLEPNITWDVTPNLNLSPYLNITTGQRIAFDTTSYNLILTYKFK